MRNRPGLLHLALVVVALLISGAACAESYWPDLPDSLETVIDEPVFGGKAWVFEAGRGHARSVVLVHGLGEDASQSWEQVVPDLARDYHVVVFDLPGFGRSTRANELYNPERYAAFVDIVVSRFVEGPFALVGHSMGGAIALCYAGAHPDKVERLVLVDVAGILYRTAYSEGVVLGGIEHLPGSYPGQGAVSRWIGGLISKTAGLSDITAGVEDRVLGNADARERFFGGNPNKIAGYALLAEDFSSWIPRVTSPTLVVWGGEDTIAPLRTGKLLAGNIPGARLELIPGGRHAPMKHEPRRFRRVLGEYLAVPSGELAAGKAPGSPYALRPDVSWQSERVGRCENRGRQQVFKGEFERIIIDGCKDVLLSDVRVHQVRIVDSVVAIENSVIRSEGTALLVTRSQVTVTAGRIEGSTVVTVRGGRLDFAGTFLKAGRKVIEVPEDEEDDDTVRVLFSVSRVESPSTSGSLHGPRKVGPRR